MRDTTKIPEGLKVAGWIVAGLLAFFAFMSLGETLVFKVFRRHLLAVKIVATALCIVAGLAIWLRQSYTKPAWLTNDRLAWIAGVCGFFGLLLLSPFRSESDPL